MAKKLFGQTSNSNLKDFNRKELGQVETKRKSGIQTASEETRKKILGRKVNG